MRSTVLPADYSRPMVEIMPRLPRYRLLTGTDDAAFCVRVSEALDQGYALYAAPTVTAVGARVVVAQAVVWPHETPTPPEFS